MDYQIDAIKAAIDLRVYIQSQGIKLTKAGLQWRGLCPFHKEKTPSFYVHQDKQMWHCKGCGLGGDLFSFVERLEGVQFRQAVRILAEHAGIQLESFTAEQRAEYAKARAERERAEAWRKKRIAEITAMRNDYMDLYHRARRLILRFGRSPILLEHFELGKKYRHLDDCLDVLRSASSDVVLELWRDKVK